MKKKNIQESKKCNDSFIFGVLVTILSFILIGLILNNTNDYLESKYLTRQEAIEINNLEYRIKILEDELIKQNDKTK